MPRFIGRQRLVQTANPVTKAPISPVTVQNLTTGAHVRTVAEFVARLPANVRNQLGDLGAYRLENDLDCYYVVADHGDVNGFRVLDYDVWESKAAHDSGAPPVWRNTHLYQTHGATGPAIEARIAAAIEDEIRDADLRGRPAWERDERPPRAANPSLRAAERRPA